MEETSCRLEDVEGELIDDYSENPLIPTEMGRRSFTVTQEKIFALTRDDNWELNTRALPR